MSSTAILLVPALATPAFAVGIWLGIRSVTGEAAAERRQARCITVLRSPTWPESRRAR
ncbi:hypothetical protein [Nocardia niigatensis]|uniref:hypothetical protein n=1 Tax=Nocardia niigatensis TaxID=209249 RepID=UPI0002E12D03|nr:hypothetical protein [Nocardia niigatensis]